MSKNNPRCWALVIAVVWYWPTMLTDSMSWCLCWLNADVTEPRLRAMLLTSDAKPIAMYSKCLTLGTGEYTLVLFQFHCTDSSHLDRENYCRMPTSFCRELHHRLFVYLRS